MGDNKIYFDFTSLPGRGVGGSGDSSRSSFLSEIDGESGDEHVPRNDISRLLVENDWEDALSMIVDATLNSNGDANIACDAEKRGKEQGMLPLHYACREGAPSDIIRELLKLNPESVSACAGESGWIPLHFVAAGKKMQVDRYYHERYDDDDGSIGSCTAECMLCKDTCRRVTTARHLIAASPACINTADHDGMSSLHVSCIEEAEPGLLNIILDFDPIVASMPDDDGNLPLHWIFRKDISVESVQKMLHAFPNGAQSANSNGALPLHKACVVGSPLEVIRLLLLQYPHGAMTRDNHGNLPLHLIIPKLPGEGIKQKERERDIQARTKIVRELLDSYPEGAGVRNNHGETSLMRALSEEVPLEIVKLLIDVDSNYSTKNMISKECALLTPLHLAATYNAPIDVVHALLDVSPQQASHLANDGPGGAHLPIHAACRTGASIDTIKALIRIYPEGTMIPDGNDGRLPLHLECMTRCQPDVIRTLLDANEEGAKVVDTRGRLALHYAAEPNKAGCGEAAKILLEVFPAALEVRDEDALYPCVNLTSKQDGVGYKVDEEEIDVVVEQKAVRFA